MPGVAANEQVTRGLRNQGPMVPPRPRGLRNQGPMVPPRPT